MKPKFGLRVISFALLLLLHGIPTSAQEPTLRDQAKESPIPWQLQNMPMNSNLRCVGIASVAEALLEGQMSDESKISLDQLATSIFENLSADKPVAYPAEVTIEGKRFSISETFVLDELSTRVADLYKNEDSHIRKQPRGLGKLRAAQAIAISSESEFEKALKNDADGAEVFCCFGSREFASGTYKEAAHAVVLKRTEDGTILLFDPNDPGKPIECRFRVYRGKLVAIWTCGYRTSGYETTQRCTLVPKSRFFRIVRE